MKGQFALESMMSYGWMIFAVLIVLGIAASFYFVDDSDIPDDCLFDAHFVCLGSTVTAEGISFELKNVGETTTLKDIIITAQRGDCTPTAIQVTDFGGNVVSAPFDELWKKDARKQISIACSVFGPVDVDVAISHQEAQFIKTSSGYVVGSP